MGRESLLAEEIGEVLYLCMYFAWATWDSELSRSSRRVKITGLGTVQLWLQSVPLNLVQKNCIKNWN